ncbi:MAG: NAD-dependent epimerase/dehydratase family protein [Myxococcota bacterium]
MPRTWAITGATGLLGNNLARALVERGEHVRLLVRGASRKELDGIDAERVEGDLADASALRRCFEGADVVVHSAAMVWIGYGRRAEMERVNVEGTRAACAAIAPGQRLVHVSSVDALGMRTRAQPADEDCAPQPHEEGVPYVDTKRAADRVVRESGVDHVIVHPTFMIGPWDWRPSSGKMLIEVARGKALFAPAGGNNFVHVADVVAGLIAAADGPRGRAWILGNENLTYREAWTTFARATGGRAPIGEVPRWAGMAAAWAVTPLPEGEINPASIRMGFLPHYFDPSRARRELGMPATPVEQAARDAWAWFRERGYA